MLRVQESKTRTFGYTGYHDNEPISFYPARRLTSLPKGGRIPGKGRLRRRNVKQ